MGALGDDINGENDEDGGEGEGAVPGAGVEGGGAGAMAAAAAAANAVLLQAMQLHELHALMDQDDAAIAAAASAPGLSFQQRRMARVGCIRHLSPRALLSIMEQRRAAQAAMAMRTHHLRVLVLVFTVARMVGKGSKREGRLAKKVAMQLGLVMVELRLRTPAKCSSWTQ